MVLSYQERDCFRRLLLAVMQEMKADTHVCPIFGTRFVHHFKFDCRVCFFSSAVDNQILKLKVLYNNHSPF